MLFSSTSYALARKPVGLLFLMAILLVGVMVYWLSEGRRGSAEGG